MEFSSADCGVAVQQNVGIVSVVRQSENLNETAENVVRKKPSGRLGKIKRKQQTRKEEDEGQEEEEPHPSSIHQSAVIPRAGRRE